jgi:hypothetical protein
MSYNELVALQSPGSDADTTKMTNGTSSLPPGGDVILPPGWQKHEGWSADSSSSLIPCEHNIINLHILLVLVTILIDLMEYRFATVGSN